MKFHVLSWKTGLYRKIVPSGTANDQNMGAGNCVFLSRPQKRKKVIKKRLFWAPGNKKIHIDLWFAMGLWGVTIELRRKGNETT